MIKNIFQITRIYALPMSIFCWLAAFFYAFSKGGNILYGLIALLGICFIHLGVNVFDDFIDYYFLPKKLNENGEKILLNAQRGKCEPILKSIIPHKHMLFLALELFFFGSCIGIFFIFKVGFGVIYFMILAGILCILYPILGRYLLCETGLGLLYGPLLFGGIFFVMKGYYDWHTLIICIPSMLVTVNLLYTDTLLDYDIDKNENKKTIANSFSTKFGSYNFHKFLIFMIYLSVVIVYFTKQANGFVFLTFLTLPMAINLLNSMKLYITNPDILPERNIFDGVTERWDIIEKEGSQAFMLRMYQARNFMIAFSIIFAISLLTNI